MQNPNPKVNEVHAARRIESKADFDDSVIDNIDTQEVFDVVRNINDPEHPLTLEQLNVVSIDHIYVINDQNSLASVKVEFTPTIPHCSMATLIGLAIRVKLLRSLPRRFKIDVKIREGTHQSEIAVNKQLGDKERVAAAMQNNHILDVVNQCISG